MKKYLTFIIFILMLAFVTSSHANLEKGKWNFVKEDEYCYIGSLPIETDLPKDKKRGETYILVYRMIGQNETIIQIEAGYNYKLENDIDVRLDQQETSQLYYSRTWDYSSITIGSSSIRDLALPNPEYEGEIRDYKQLEYPLLLNFLQK